MARLGTAGFEWQQLEADYGISVNTGAPAISTTTVRSGTGSASCGNAASFTWAPVTSLTQNRGYFIRFYLRITGTPSADCSVLQYAPLGAVKFDLRLTTSRTLQLRDVAAANVGSASAALSINTWYRVEVNFVIPNAGSGSLGLRLDGSTVQATTSASVGTSVGFANFLFGDPAATNPGITSFFDDLALNDNQGTSQADFPGAGSVLLLRPISDNAIDANWRNGASGTTNLWDAVNNLPPTGSSTPGATTQIQYVGASATANYDANATSYTTAGITALDLISLVQAVGQGAAANSSFSKTLAIRSASNPTDSAEVSSAVAIAAATPSGWTTLAGNVVYLPTVTLGTSPVVRIGNRDTNSETGYCDALGLLVEYVPNGAASPPVPDHLYRKLQAVQRAANW